MITEISGKEILSALFMKNFRIYYASFKHAVIVYAIAAKREFVPVCLEPASKIFRFRRKPYFIEMLIIDITERMLVL